MLRRIVVSSAIALGCACGDDPGPLPASLASTRPEGVDRGLLYVVNDQREWPEEDDRTAPQTTERGHVVRLDLSGNKASLDSEELPPGFARSYPRPQHPGQVVVLTTGHDQYKKKRKIIPAENAHVRVYDSKLQATDVRLGGNFNALTLSDDGRFAVAYSPSGNQAALNGIEVVDLNALTSGTATSTSRTLGLDGRAPTRILFSPAGSLSRRMLVVLFPDAVQLLDLEQAMAGEISIPLKIPSDPRTLSPQEVLFHRQPAAAGAVTERIYVRSAGSNQVLVLTLGQDSTGKPSVATSLKTAAQAITDMEIVDTELGSRLLLLANGLEVVDLGETQPEPVRLATAGEFTSLHPFRGASPVDPAALWRAMLYNIGSARIGFVEVSGPSTWATRSVELAELGEPLRSIIPLKRRNLVLGLHGGQRLSIIDLEQRRIVPINLESNLASLLVDETEQHARLWTANQSGIVSVLDLVTRKRTPIPVAFTPAMLSGASVENGTILLVPGTPRRVALVQEAERGRVTTLNADFVAENVEGTLEAKELVGFFFAGLFD